MHSFLKKLFLLTGLLSGGALFAESIVVFAKGDSVALDATTAASIRTNPPQKTFLAAVRADLAHPAAFAVPFNLSTPPAWGKTIATASGKIEFHDAFHGGFFVRVALTGLAPNHRYILTLNGNPKLAGNERLIDAVPGIETERYFDFLTVTTNAQGHYSATFGIALIPGPYDVRFYVKDTDDFKIVLYHDYFKFVVE
jgi:hypothetical protein